MKLCHVKLRRNFYRIQNTWIFRKAGYISARKLKPSGSSPHTLMDGNWTRTPALNHLRWANSEVHVYVMHSKRLLPRVRWQMFWTLKPHGLCCSYSILLLQIESNHKQFGNEWSWLCYNTILFIDAEIWISQFLRDMILGTIIKHKSHSELMDSIKAGCTWPPGSSEPTPNWHYLLKFLSGFHGGILLENPPFIAFLIFLVLLLLSPNSIPGNHLPNKLLELEHSSWGLLLGETKLRQPAWLIHGRTECSLLWHHEDPQKDSCLRVDLRKGSFHYILSLTVRCIKNV